MIDPDTITSVIFDFDGTLCSGRYFAPLGADALRRIGRLVFGENSARWADPWMRGELTCRDIAGYLSGHLDLSEDHILSALREGCANLTFNPAVHAFARQQREAGRKTALVTANMDVFTEVVVPAHGLDALFDIVLNTADHGTLDKDVLWRKAFATFGPEHTYASSLLIEDNPKMTALFESLGGNAHQYVEDGAFRMWLAEVGF
ncbi:MAG: haloacid dehalogenase-like hydrolase [bacterium]|nr:haloacid dehalogenase-like hydrolase [bacterium]